MNYHLAPSALSADFGRAAEQLDLLERAGVTYLHLDVMDGMFVPNISFGMPVIASLRKCSKMLFDVHLMIVEPERYIADFRKAGADFICFHLEATKDPAAVLAQIKETGAKAAIAIKPKTPVEAVKPYLADADMLLVMTVEPGFGGQKFMQDMMPKVRQLATWREELGLSYDIEVDGGIAMDTVRTAMDAGANVLVAGSAVFGKADIAAAAEEYLKIFEEYAK